MQQAAHPSIFHLSHPDILRTKDNTRVIYSFSTLLVGIILFIFSFRIDTEILMIPISLLLASVALILVAIYNFFWKSWHYVFIPGHSPLKETSLFLDHRTLDKTINLLVSQGCLVDMSGLASKKMYYLVTLVSKDKKFAALQLFLFAHYTYTPLSDVCFLYGEEVERLLGM